MTQELILLLSDNRGQYIPQNFIEQYGDDLVNVSDEDKQILLAGPYHELYSEAWDTVLMDGIIRMDGNVYTLYQDGDLWAVPDGYEWPED